MAGLRERFPPRRIARLLGWNALILFILLALAAGGAEAYLRLSAPRPPAFPESYLPIRLVPGAGVIRPPHTEIHYTNERDFWQTSRTNSLGFLDREPPSPGRAAESCHVTLIGDSYVEALEVPIADKAQVRLEELAAREAPELDVTASAFGHRATAQISQLAFYDAFARHLSPDVVVLAAVRNDLWGNSVAIQAWRDGFHPDHPPWLYARPGPDGEMDFVPPAASLDELRAHRLPLPPENFMGRTERKLREWSYLADWTWTRVSGLPRPWPERLRRYPSAAVRRAWAETISQHPRHRNFAEGWDPAAWRRSEHLAEENLAPIFREALDVMRFALEQFRERAERDGAALVILAVYDLRGAGDPWFERLREIAAGIGEGGIPVIDQYDYIMDAGNEIADAHWEHDYHWTPAGHRWAAEAILQWLKANREVCD